MSRTSLEPCLSRLYVTSHTRHCFTYFIHQLTYCSVQILFETLIALMTLYKAFIHARALQTISAIPILVTLTRDGMVYFVAILSLLLFNCIIWFLLSRSLLYLAIYLPSALVATMVSRFFINLRKVTRFDAFSTNFATMREREVMAIRSQSHDLNRRVQAQGSGNEDAEYSWDS